MITFYYLIIVYKILIKKFNFYNLWCFWEIYKIPKLGFIVIGPGVQIILEPQTSSASKYARPRAKWMCVEVLNDGGKKEYIFFFFACQVIWIHTYNCIRVCMGPHSCKKVIIFIYVVHPFHQLYWAQKLHGSWERDLPPTNPVRKVCVVCVVGVMILNRFFFPIVCSHWMLLLERVFCLHANILAVDHWNVIILIKMRRKTALTINHWRRRLLFLRQVFLMTSRYYIANCFFFFLLLKSYANFVSFDV